MTSMKEFDRVIAALSSTNLKPDQRVIAQKGIEVLSMLLEKNLAYGSSAFNPISVFARGLDPLAQIHVRMDDKLARLAMGHEISDESFADTIFDLAGYCILELVARERHAKEGPGGAAS